MKSRVHISLEVSDLDRSVSFYESLFSEKASKRKQDYANFRMDQPSLHLALVRDQSKKQKPDENRGQGHYGVEVMSQDALSRLKNSVKRNGLKVFEQEQVTCCYATADKFWARDPDGYQWEFWVRLQDQPVEKKNSCGIKEACC